MLDGALANLQSLGHEPDYFKGKVFTADSNYHTQVNLRKCQELGLDAYIPDRKFRNRDPRLPLRSGGSLAGLATLPGGGIFKIDFVAG